MTETDPTVTITERPAILAGIEYELRGGTIDAKWASALQPGEEAFCRFVVYNDAFIGSFGGSVWPGAYPRLFTFVRRVRLTEYGRKLLAAATRPNPNRRPRSMTTKRERIHQLAHTAAGNGTRLDAGRLGRLADKLTAQDLEDLIELLDDARNAGQRSERAAMDTTAEGPRATYFRDWLNDLRGAVAVLLDPGPAAKVPIEARVRELLVDPAARRARPAPPDPPRPPEPIPPAEARGATIGRARPKAR